MASDWLNEQHEIADMLRGIAYRLDGLAGAFYDTGNAVVADKLSLIEGDVTCVREMVQRGTVHVVNDMGRQTFEGITNMLNMAVVMDKLVNEG